MALAQEVKAILPMRRVAEGYGFEINQAGFIKCPFHSGDKNGSLKIYPGDRGWYCFGCHAGGSVIDFAMKLFDVNFKDAVARLNADFHLGLSDTGPSSKAVSEALERRRAEQERKNQADALYKRKTAELWHWRSVRDKAEPYSAEWAAAVSKIDYLEYWLDENLGGG